MKIKNLQYQLSNGDWVNCDNRTDEFLARCVEFGGVSDEAEAIKKLESGSILRNWEDGWNSNCQIKPEEKPLSESEQEYHRNMYVCKEETLDY